VSEETINPLPTAGSTFLEVLRAFLQNEDADRFVQQFRGYVVSGGIHGAVAGLTATPTPLTAYPGGLYTTETGAITYADASTTHVIAHSDTTGNEGSYIRVPGTHYLTAVGGAAPTLPASCVRLMTVTTAGGAITAVADVRELSPLYNETGQPYVRLAGTEASGEDYKILENSGLLQVHRNDGTNDAPVWTVLLGMAFPDVSVGWDLSLITAPRYQVFPDKDGTFAMLSDISAGLFAAGTRMLFDQDAAPTGWTRDTTASLDDRVLRLVTGARADGGSWTITGLSMVPHAHSMSDHHHGVPVSGSDGVTQGGIAKAASWPFGTGGVATLDRGGAIDAEFSGNILMSAGPDTANTDAQAPAASSDGTWRPLHRDVIVCTKD